MTAKQEIKKGDLVDIGLKNISGLSKLLVVRTIHKDNTITLEDLFGRYYGRIERDLIKEVNA